MIYDQVEIKTKRNKNYIALTKEAAGLVDKVEILKLQIRGEDSKKREAEMQEEIIRLKKRQHEIRYEKSSVEEKVFKTLLAEEYGVVGNPKFDKAYAIAYDMGHSSGYSEIENYFMQLVELIK